MKRRLAFYAHLAIRLVGIAWVVLALNIIAVRHDARLDTTDKRLFTLHPETLKTLRSLDDIVHITFYNTGEWPVSMQTAQERVRAALDEFVKTARGNVVFQEVNPLAGLPDGPERDDVMHKMDASGVQFHYINSGDPLKGAQIGFFALRVLHKGRQDVINNPDAEDWNLEYRLMAAINKLGQTRRTIGVLAPNPKASIDTDFPHVLALLNELGLARKIFPVAENEYRIDPALDALVVLSPRLISENTLKSIDAFVMSGKPVIVATDGMVPMNATSFVPNSTPFHDLLAYYGIDVHTNIVYELSPDLALMDLVPMGKDRKIKMPNYYIFRAVRKHMDHGSTLLKGINDVVLYYATGLAPVLPPPSGVTVTPLIWTSENSGADEPQRDSVFVSPIPDPTRKFEKAALAPRTVLVEAAGRFPCYTRELRRLATEEGRPIEEGEDLARSLEAAVGWKRGDPLPDRGNPGRIVVFGGSLFLRVKANDSGTALLQNVIEQLLYNQSLSELRTERQLVRTFRPDLTDVKRQSIRAWGITAVPVAVLALGVVSMVARRGVRRVRARRLLEP